MQTMEKEKVKQIIRGAIHTALLVDDEYGNPFLDSDKSIEIVKNIHKSFREEGHCLMDIYPYDNFESLMEKKDGVFINHDLLILDWELQPGANPPYLDSLKLLDYVVNSTEIRYVVIYTNTPNTEDILYNLVSNFSPLSDDEHLLDEIRKVTEDLIDDKGIDAEIDEIERNVENCVKGVLMNPKLVRDASRAISDNIKNVFGEYNKDFCQAISGLLRSYGKDAKEVMYKVLDMKRSRAEAIDSFSQMTFFPIDSHALRLNNTIVIVIGKSRHQDGVDADALYDAIVDKLMQLPNHGSLLFSLKLRAALSRELGKIGKSIGVIEEGALLHHAKTYTDENNLTDYVAECVACMVEDLIHRDVNTHEFKELFDEEDDDSCENEELIALNRLLTFTPVDEMFGGKHKMVQGDIFKVDSPLATEYNYLMCISAACDCARPEEKIAYNYAFALGKAVKPDTVLKDVEKKHYTFINCDEAVEWDKKFMTIYMKGYEEFNMRDEIIVQLGAAEKRKMTYLGRMKRFYAQRVATMVFSNAHRIGVDLPK